MARNFHSHPSKVAERLSVDRALSPTSRPSEVLFRGLLSSPSNSGAAGGGTAPVPTRGGGQPRGGLSPEHSRWAEPPLPAGRQKPEARRSTPNPKVPIAEQSLLRASGLRSAFRSMNI